MKRRMMLIVLLLSVLDLPAQQYLIRYDLVADDIRYFRIRKPGDTTVVPIIPVGSRNRVNLQLINLSGGFTRQVVMHEKAETPENVIIPGIGNTPINHIGSFMGQDAGRLNPADLFVEKPGDTKSIEDQQKKIQVARFAGAFNDFTANYNNWGSAMLFNLNMERLWKLMVEIRFTTTYSGDRARQIAQSQWDLAFPGVSNPDMILFETRGQNADGYLQEMRTGYNRALETSKELASLGASMPAMDSLLEAMRQKLNVARHATIPVFEGSEMLPRIKNLYSQIISDSYMHVIPLALKRNTQTAEIRLLPLTDSITAAALGNGGSDTIYRWVRILKKEPLRFRNSFGFSFVIPGQGSWSYFVNADSVVCRQKGDSYLPVISTMLNFYAPKDRGFRWGGSLGVGLPITGDDKQLQVLLGLSCFLGTNDPVVLSFGLVASRVNQLAGLAVGDKLTNPEAALPFKRVYRTGFFVGVSFNPASFNVTD